MDYFCLLCNLFFKSLPKSDSDASDEDDAVETIVKKPKTDDFLTKASKPITHQVESSKSKISMGIKKKSTSLDNAAKPASTVTNPPLALSSLLSAYDNSSSEEN